MPKVSGFCRECGKAITYWPSQNRQFCSGSCAARVRARVNPLPTGQKKRRGTTTPCEVCAKPVYANRSERAKGAGRFCSHACHNIAQTKEPVIKSCPICGKELRLKPSQAARIYCSSLCKGRGATKRPLERWHNGRPARLDQFGYVLVWQPDFPAPAAQKGWVYEHRLVAAKAVGRPLTSREEVDHINRDKQDNRPENLQVMDRFSHLLKTQQDSRQDRLDLAEFRRRYGSIE